MISSQLGEHGLAQLAALLRDVGCRAHLLHVLCETRQNLVNVVVLGIVDTALPALVLHNLGDGGVVHEGDSGEQVVLNLQWCK